MNRFQEWLFNRVQELERKEGRRLSITEVADLIGVAQPTFSRWYNGRTIPDENEHIMKLARLFGNDVFIILNTPMPELDYVKVAYSELPDEAARQLFVRELQEFINTWVDKNKEKASGSNHRRKARYG